MTTAHRRSLLLAAASALCLGLGASDALAASTTSFFHSRKDLGPAKVTWNKRPSGTYPGDIFITPRPAPNAPQQGPMILDSDGRLVWFHPVKKGLTSVDFQTQRYKGRPVLTWSERPIVQGTNIFAGAADQEFDVIFDSKYKQIRRMQVHGPGEHTQLHEFVLTKSGNAILVGYRFIKADARGEGGTSSQTVVDQVVQVQSLKTGRVLFDWHAINHVPLSSSYVKAQPGHAYDYFHLNSVNVSSDHNLIISARHTSAFYKVSLKTGKVIWTAGGKHSDFKLGKGARFYYQHDVVDRGKGVYTMFDNHGSDFDRTHGKQSRGLMLQLRLKKSGSTATVKRQFQVPSRLSISQGNFQKLPNGNWFVGWGVQPFASEFSPTGRLLSDLALPSMRYQSYRTFKYAWSATPPTKPAFVASTKDGTITGFVSWNGATDVKSWAVLGGSSPVGLARVATFPKTNFETKFKLADRPYVQVQALDASGNVIGTSAAIQPKTG